MGPRAWFRNASRLFFGRPRMEAELDEELRAYRDLLVERNVAAGLSEPEARRAAQIEMQGLEQVKEQVRDVRAGAALDAALQDARGAIRSMARYPAFTALVVLTLALGIGVNTAIFSVFYAEILNPLPYDRPEQLMLVWSQFHKTGALRAPTSGVALKEIRQRSRVFQDVAGIWVGGGAFLDEGLTPEQAKIGQVTSNFFSVLGAQAAIGRTFLGEERAGGRLAIVLSHGLWQRRFGGDPSIVGKQVRLDGGSLTVVGVMPEGFHLRFPADSNVPADIQAWMPFPNAIERGPVTLYYIRVLGRLKPGVTVQQAQEDACLVAAQIRSLYPPFADEDLKLEVAPLHADAVRDVKPALTALFAGAGLVLLICCVNVANLLLARSASRRKEIAMRAALGASEGRILRQLLTEGLVLCSVAGAAGLALGWSSLWLLQRIRPEQLDRLREIQWNGPVLVFTVLASCGSALLFGLAPIRESAKPGLLETLGGSCRSEATPGRGSARAVLIASEITLAFVLLVGAGLMMRTLAAIRNSPLGFEKDRLLTLAFDLPFGRYRRNVDRDHFVQAWEARLHAIPGVEAAGAVSHLPLGDYPNWYSPYRPEGLAAAQTRGLLADYRAVTTGYLQAMRATLIEGRVFDDRDTAEGRQVVIVDETLARQTWPGRSAVGQKIEVEQYRDGRFKPVETQVVGVIRHIQHHGLTKIVRGQIYIPYAQSARPHLSYAVRTRGDPQEIAAAVRTELAALDKLLAISAMQPMTRYVERAEAPASFTAILAAVFAALAVTLAAIGVYGVVSYSVGRRTHELGVRMALGASAGQVLRMVLREGLVITAAGLALGVAGSLALSRWLATLLFGVSPADPLTYGAALGAVFLAAMIACWRPARRAAAVSPVQAMRTD